jgi:excinuclease UvrABC helicase subunit UvrB
MLKAARDLEFEEAARLRDQAHRMRDFSMGLTDEKAS